MILEEFDPTKKVEKYILNDVERVVGLYKSLTEEMSALTPQIDDFEMYPEEDRTKDFREVMRLERKFKEINALAEDPEQREHMSRVAFIGESLLVKNISNSWFGEKAKATPTCRFDDYINGIDLVIEFDKGENPNEYTGLSIDATFSADKDLVFKKLDEIFNACKKNVLGKVKYFHSRYKKGDEPEFMGELPQVARGVAVIPPKHLTELMELELSHNTVEIAEHVFQAILLLQLQLQYEEIIAVATENGATDVVATYQRSLDEIKTIIDSEHLQRVIKSHPKSIQEDRGLDLMKTFFEEKKKSL